MAIINSTGYDKAKELQKIENIYQKSKYLKEQVSQDSSAVENVSLQDLEKIQGEKTKKSKKWFLW